MKAVFPLSSWSIQMEISSEMVRIESDQALSVLSSAIYGEGKLETKTLINRYVGLAYDCEKPEDEVRTWLLRHGYSADAVVLLTAAYVHLARIKVIDTSLFRLAAIVTAGVSNAARAGETYPIFIDRLQMPGTINIMLVIDGYLTESAFVNAVIMATEAKAAALQEMKVKDGKGKIATGTTTDAIVVAATQEKIGGYVHRYTGATSPLGQAISQAVYQTVKEALQTQ